MTIDQQERSRIADHAGTDPRQENKLQHIKAENWRGVPVEMLHPAGLWR